MLGAGKISQALYHGCVVGSHGAAVLLKDGTAVCGYGKDLFPADYVFPLFPADYAFPLFPADYAFPLFPADCADWSADYADLIEN